MVYEVATFQTLREQLRCKEIWVVGADRWRNPDEDLPTDFESRRAEHYRELRKPLDPTEFCDSLREEMTSALAKLNDALPSLDWVEISDRKAGAIKLSPIEAAPEPRNLRRIKNEVARRWSAVPLIDILFAGATMLQDVLAEPEWSALLTPVDRRGLTPLFWLHIRPYGEVRLDLSARLSIGTLGSLGSA
ncbi:hypothetical protein ACGFNP_46320 [Nonomuraea sp. NPDC049269]|uniref:hypothetical protein n=1 Tax=Nonomuraea sp. NPDC049269 TaxID=3364349 RepID=UPI00371A07A3